MFPLFFRIFSILCLCYSLYYFWSNILPFIYYYAFSLQLPTVFFFLFKFFLKADKHWESKLFHSTFLSGEVIMWKFIHLVIRSQVISLYYIDLEKKKSHIFVARLWSTVMALHKRFEKTRWNVSNQTRLERLHGVVL